MNPFKLSYKWVASGLSGKTAWDWLELLVVPLGLAVGVFYLESRVENRQGSMADERVKQEVLDGYLEKMQELLLDRNLRGAEEESEVRSVARAITTTAIRELDSDRNTLLISFLKESRLIQKKENIQKKS